MAHFQAQYRNSPRLIIHNSFNNVLSAEVRVESHVKTIMNDEWVEILKVFAAVFAWGSEENHVILHSNLSYSRDLIAVPSEYRSSELPPHHHARFYSSA